MSGHTPGPWSVFDENAAQQLIVNDKTTIANTMCGNDRANARLIAAAPELLEELRCALMYFESRENIGDEPNEETLIASSIRAAIAKATQS